MKQTPKTLIQLCKLLSDLKVHDGNQIGERLHVSRTAIWKHIKKLKSYHVDINSIQSKGYQLQSPLLLIDPDQIKTNLSKDIFIELFESLDSTNDYLLYNKKDNLPHICLAETQTKGKGRFNKPWFAPFGENIYLSIATKPNIDLSDIGGFALAVGIGACEAIESIINLPKKLSLKWPNDIFYNGKKLGGILIETQAEANGNLYLVIGIGININMLNTKKTDHHINQAWTSIREITSTYQDRNPLIANIINHTLSLITQYETSGLFPLLDQWRQRDMLYENKIEIISGKQNYQGTAQGINAQGHLILKLDDQSTRVFASGEASIKK
ncbi:biotin--[acetyl-CoA-carboxylase] ligase [Thiotrichales bacterium 19S9-12]|nr:biotin--[acetyl-CoA-carboxylase] ligase [Thiotrichales bacterium 19S9-11]MCF6812135.1 biotin--[acetyl-CoA-carboxylase] ligase [Thiotrichales bacterium 19S9-12]